MSFVFKTVEPSHITVNPFYANKLWEVGSVSLSDLTDPGDNYVGGDISMSVYFGRNVTTPVLDITTEETTTHGNYSRAVWASVNSLYYRDFDTDPLTHYAQGVDYFETRSITDTIQVFSIPQKIFGRGIERGSFRLTIGGTVYTDDSNGNIITGTTHHGNIIYNQGIVVWTNAAGPFNGTSCTFTNLTFRSTKLINSYEVICVSEADSHNMSDNTSLLAIQSTAQNPGIGPNEPGNYNNDGECYSFVTGSVFSPYITSVGLYNDEGDLLVIAKMARPIKKAINCDTIFVVRWDS